MFSIAFDMVDRQTFDESIVQSIETFLPYRDEFISVLSTVARYSNANHDKPLRSFFEKIIRYMFRPKSVMQYNEWYWDNFKFIVHEMFLYAIGILLKYERFDLVLDLMSQGYYVADALDNSREPMEQFGIIWQPIQSLTYRNKRLNLNRISVRADMLEKRSHASGLPFVYLMQADFVLFFFNSVTSLKEHGRRRWWPETLLYYREYSPPFEIFARSESVQYFQKICPLIAIKNKAELGETFKLFGFQNTPLYLPNWDYGETFSLTGATNFEKLATKP